MKFSSFFGVNHGNAKCVKCGKYLYTYVRYNKTKEKFCTKCASKVIREEFGCIESLKWLFKIRFRMLKSFLEDINWKNLALLVFIAISCFCFFINKQFLALFIAFLYIIELADN